MGLFIRKKQKNETENIDIIEINALKNANTAINYAKSFEKKFDYSENSLNGLEEILNYYSEDIPKSKPTENQIWSMALIFGSYLGELMLKKGLSKKCYKWKKNSDSNIPLLANENGSYITPIDKVYKRLVNGNEDNIISFYDIVMELN